MAPYPRSANPPTEITGVLDECDAETIDGGLLKDVKQLKRAEKRQLTLVWPNIIIFTTLHIAALYGVWLALTSAKWATLAFSQFLVFASGMGITAGAHRLWAHRAYKAKWPLRLLLVICNTIAFQDAAIDWARDHRVHHKYSETDADPYNATRGFFFSHIGWLLCRKHPDVTIKGKGVDISDLEKDPFLYYQKKYYKPLAILACFIIPSVVAVYFWNETWMNAIFVPAIYRYTLCLNGTWLVNSAAHKFGGKPYDKDINPSQNHFVSLFAFGEGWHNYHHVYPWDYKTAELGNYSLNFTTAFIDFCAKIGWAYDLKSVSSDIIEKRVRRTGDGTHNLWGWDDKGQNKKEMENAIVTHRT